MALSFTFWLINTAKSPRYLMKKIARYLENGEHGNKTLSQLEAEVKDRFNAIIKITSL